MNVKPFALAIALASIGGTAHAQSLTVTGSAVGQTSFTYTYMVTPSFNANQLIFNFSDANVTFASYTGASPLTLQTNGTIPNGGVFTFAGGSLPANTAETFNFFSPDAPGGALGAVGLQYSTATVAAVNGVTPAPSAAPEPGGMTALAVLFGCLGVGLIAKRRTAVASAL